MRNQRAYRRRDPLATEFFRRLGGPLSTVEGTGSAEEELNERRNHINMVEFIFDQIESNYPKNYFETLRKVIIFKIKFNNLLVKYKYAELKTMTLRWRRAEASSW